MKFHHLRDVIAVAERGSLRAAARHLGIAQPTLTRSIRELERELGAALFERRARGMTVTPIGERFIQRAASAQSELARARDEVAQLKGEGEGMLRVVLSSVSHIALLPDALAAFQRRYPNVALDLTEGVFPASEAALRGGLADVYIGPPPPLSTAEGLLVEKLFDNSRAVVCRKGHPLAQARSLRELVDAPWLTSSITYRPEDEVAPLFARHGLPAPRIVMQAHSSLSFLTALLNSDMLMMLPVQWLAAPLTRDVLYAIPIRETLPTPPICIVRRAGLPLTPAAEYFCDMIRRAAGYMKPAAGALKGDALKGDALKGSPLKGGAAKRGTVKQGAKSRKAPAKAAPRARKNAKAG
jgi:DNA-binding transcriptional LysR family regulator